jgi:glucosylglycerate hydrolase
MSPTFQRSTLDGASLAERAAAVLRDNDLGSLVTAAPELYPHMWSWDAAFISVGLAHLDPNRAIRELETLLAAQWRTGMLPHIVFSDASADYFPGPDRWGTEVSPDAPVSVRTSGICQPPVHVIALDRILQIAQRTGNGDAVESFARNNWFKMYSWHRWLALQRDPHGTGLLEIVHGWESGMDNAPRWDGPYRGVHVGNDLPAYTRRDLAVVGDGGQRPSDSEYDRYLWLIEEMRRVRYEPAEVLRTSSFHATDVFTTAIFVVASETLAHLGARLGQPAEQVDELRYWADRSRAAVVASRDPATGLARDRDERTGEWLAQETIAGFAPLLCGGLDTVAEDRLWSTMCGTAWAGHPGFFAAVPPSTTPASVHFESRRYWRGPQWPVMSWLLGWALDRRGHGERAAGMRAEGLRLTADAAFGEYYEPFTGEPLGSRNQSWTAAVVLDWLANPA